MDWQMSASEGLAFGAGALQGAASIVFAIGRGFRPAWGLGTLALSFGCASVLNLLVSTLRWTTPDWRSPVFTGTTLLGLLVLATLWVGLMQFGGRPPRRPVLGALVVVVVFVVTSTALRAAGAGVNAGAFTAGLAFMGMALMFQRAAKADFFLIGWPVTLALLSYPALLPLALQAGADPVALRLWGAVPFALVGLSVMVVALWRYHQELSNELARRERAEAELRQLNQSLEQRVAERTAELNEMVTGLESFNRMVSHDLRGPLGGLAGLSELAGKAVADGETERGLHLLGVMRRESTRLTELVADLLTLARVTHAELDTRVQPLDEVLATALATLSISHGDRALTHIAADRLPEARVDAGLLRQVFVNLLGNALKFTAGKAEPRVSVQASRDTDGQWVIEVRDNGVGFPPERSVELFQPFRRLHGAKFEGTGVGLTIVRRIVERHGGRVWAQCRPGHGASFFFSLPG